MAQQAAGAPVTPHSQGTGCPQPPAPHWPGLGHVPPAEQPPPKAPWRGLTPLPRAEGCHSHGGGGLLGRKTGSQCPGVGPWAAQRLRDPGADGPGSNAVPPLSGRPCDRGEMAPSLCASVSSVTEPVAGREEQRKESWCCDENSTRVDRGTFLAAGGAHSRGVPTGEWVPTPTPTGGVLFRFGRQGPAGSRPSVAGPRKGPSQCKGPDTDPFLCVLRITTGPAEVNPQGQAACGGREGRRGETGCRVSVWGGGRMFWNWWRGRSQPRAGTDHQGAAR